MWYYVGNKGENMETENVFLISRLNADNPKQEHKSVFWQGIRIGSCGQPIDLFRLGIGRVRAISDILIGFDGERNGWVIFGSFYTPNGDDIEIKEVHFIPETLTDEGRFY